MITTQLLRPESIVVVGASNNVHKPGGAILKNLINGGYRGELRAVNPKEKEVQGVPAQKDDYFPFCIESETRDAERSDFGTRRYSH